MTRRTKQHARLRQTIREIHAANAHIPPDEIQKIQATYDFWRGAIDTRLNPHLRDLQLADVLACTEDIAIKFTNAVSILPRNQN